MKGYLFATSQAVLEITAIVVFIGLLGGVFFFIYEFGKIFLLFVLAHLPALPWFEKISDQTQAFLIITFFITGLLTPLLMNFIDRVRDIRNNQRSFLEFE